MRIVAGTLKGRRIEAPAGEGTRPTVDRVREALFSSLYSLQGTFEGACVLDAFAGSGALGIEALSRGAATAVFFERDVKAAATCERNISTCGLEARVVKRDFIAHPPEWQNPPFDLVFLDPPYAYDPVQVLEPIVRLRDADAVAEGAIIVYEHDLKSADAVAGAVGGAGLDFLAVKKYGKTGVAIARA